MMGWNLYNHYNQLATIEFEQIYESVRYGCPSSLCKANNTITYSKWNL